MTVTTEQLAEWERLADEATEGPWEDGGPSPSVTVIMMVDAGCTHPESPEPPRYEAIAYLHDGAATNYEGERPQQPLADARFIAASRLAVPQLVAEVRRLRGIIKAAYLEGWCDGNGYLPLPPDQATEVSAERCWDESEAKG